jgi:hypothetical protein
MYLGNRKSFLVGGSVLLVAGIAIAAATRAHLNAERNAEANAAAAVQPTPLVVPADTPIHVTLDQSLASNQSRPGQHFEATISQPIVIDGTTVVPQGAHAEGLVVDARPSGRLKGIARLQITLVSLEADGSSYDIQTKSSTQTGGNHNKRNLGWIGGGAGDCAAVPGNVEGANKLGMERGRAEETTSPGSTVYSEANLRRGAESLANSRAVQIGSDYEPSSQTTILVGIRSIMPARSSPCIRCSPNQMDEIQEFAVGILF